jgi:acyl carrier protein
MADENNIVERRGRNGALHWGTQNMSHEQDIVNIVAKQAKVDAATLNRDSRLSDFDLQSIDIVELVFSIEDKFDIEVPYSPNDLDAAGISFETVGSLVDAVEKLIAEQRTQKSV